RTRAAKRSPESCSSATARSKLTAPISAASSNFTVTWRWSNSPSSIKPASEPPTYAVVEKYVAARSLKYVCALIPLKPPLVDTVAVVKFSVRINEMRLLIVEDNGQMREMIKLFLRGLADEIAERGDGTEALAAYREFAPDWVVMDI